MLGIRLLYYIRITLLETNKKMNTFTITFKNAMEEMKTEDFHLDFVTVQGVTAYFEEVFGIRVKSITKH